MVIWGYGIVIYLGTAKILSYHTFLVRKTFGIVAGTPIQPQPYLVMLKKRDPSIGSCCKTTVPKFSLRLHSFTFGRRIVGKCRANPPPYPRNLLDT
jgi:hypothetical protein